MNTVEEAYQVLATELLEFIETDLWDKAESHIEIYTQMTRTDYLRFYKDTFVNNDRFPSFEVAGAASRAALYLRDDLLRTTGARIWGLTFTLYPNGKFNLEYDYNKPEGYEETDDIITGDEMNASLNLLSGKAID
jgi:hypothetical protein